MKIEAVTKSGLVNICHIMEFINLNCHISCISKVTTSDFFCTRSAQLRSCVRSFADDVLTYLTTGSDHGSLFLQSCIQTVRSLPMKNSVNFDVLSVLRTLRRVRAFSLEHSLTVVFQCEIRPTPFPAL
ncbi:hypothetical protein V3C99_004639, partial [Haemonchus contortus]